MIQGFLCGQRVFIFRQSESESAEDGPILHSSLRASCRGSASPTARRDSRSSFSIAARRPRRVSNSRVGDHRSAGRSVASCARASSNRSSAARRSARSDARSASVCASRSLASISRCLAAAASARAAWVVEN